MSEQEQIQEAAEPPVAKPAVSLSLHGPGASIESAIEAGEAMKKLLAAVAENMGVPKGALEWRIGSVQFKCDGCGLLRADRPGPDEGWTYRDGDDLCPTCSHTADPQGSAPDSASDASPQSPA